MKNRLLFLYLFILLVPFIPVSLCSQITGNVNDLHSGEPIENANISVQNSTNGTQTNNRGEFSLTLSEFPTKITITHLNYESEIIFIVKPDQKVTISMLPKASIIDGVVISSKKIPEMITDNVRYSIHDFLWWGNELLLLEFHGDFKKSYFSRWSKDGELIDRIKLKDVKSVHTIYKACNDQIYLLGNSQMYLMGFTNKTSFVNGNLGIDTYKNFISPCELILDKEIYYKTKEYNDLLSVFNMYNAETKEIQVFTEIGEKDMIEDFRNGVGFSKQGKSPRKIQQDNDFLQSVMYKPSFEHFLFYTNQNLILFDHLNHHIKYFRNLQNTISIDIQYQFEDNWLGNIIQDEVTSELYTFFDSIKGIDIHKINIKDGSSNWVGNVNTSIRNISNFQIHDNRLYFMDDISYENSNDVVMKLDLD